MNCRICNKETVLSLEVAAPALTSMMTWLNVSTKVFTCKNCSHSQSPDLPDINSFYNTEYKISLQSNQHDQLYDIVDGEQVFRTEFQAKLVNEFTNIKFGAKVLDFGAAKATTLKFLHATRPDIVPYVFDVSDDYRGAWENWLDSGHTSTHELPAEWHNKFDLITAHFVIEHIANPVQVLKNLKEYLAPEGEIFFTIPNSMANEGDFLVVDHLNHFNMASITKLVDEAGLILKTCRQDVYRAAFVCVIGYEKNLNSSCKQVETTPTETPNEVVSILKKWQKILDQLDQIQVNFSRKKVGLYGAGFYGALALGRLKQKPVCILDRNPFLIGSQLQGIEITAPADMPNDLDILYCCLNPLIAKTAVNVDSDWLKGSPDIIYFEQ